MANLYTPMQMQELHGISATGLRIYTTTYPDYLSTEATDAAGTALVPVAALQAATALMRDAQRREEEAREQAQAVRDEAAQHERELQEQVNQLLRELGHKEGEPGGVADIEA